MLAHKQKRSTMPPRCGFTGERPSHSTLAYPVTESRGKVSEGWYGLSRCSEAIESAESQEAAPVHIVMQLKDVHFAAPPPVHYSTDPIGRGTVGACDPVGDFQDPHDPASVSAPPLPCARSSLRLRPLIRGAVLVAPGVFGAEVGTSRGLGWTRAHRAVGQVCAVIQGHFFLYGRLDEGCGGEVGRGERHAIGYFCSHVVCVCVSATLCPFFFLSGRCLGMLLGMGHYGFPLFDLSTLWLFTVMSGLFFAGRGDLRAYVVSTRNETKRRMTAAPSRVSSVAVALHMRVW